MRVPFFDYASVYAMYREEYQAVLLSVLEQGAFILQGENLQFEKALAEFMDARHVIGVANGTDAIGIALRAAGVGPGHEVILPSHTYVATAAAVHFVGATPILVECGSDHLIDPDAAEAAVTSRTRALLPVQLNGRTANMDQLGHIATKHDLEIVEDAAQGVGSRFRGRAAGTFGIAGTYSFYPAKTLGCFGDGGAVVTNDDDVAAQTRLLHDHGRDADGRVVTWGFNSRLDNLQAAALLVRLKHLPEEINRRREIAQLYQQGLAEFEEIVLPPPPQQDDDHFDTYQNYEIEVERRDELQVFLRENEVFVNVQWAGTAVHQFKELGFTVQLTKTDDLFRRCLLLPMHPMLTDDQVGFVVDRIRAFLESRA